MASKIVTLHKYISLDHVVEVMAKQRLYMDDGSNFNDPFELTVIGKEEHTIRKVEGLHVLSLTNSFRKKLMWSHYADSHKGVCLTVQVPQELVFSICYSSERVFENSDIDKIVKKSLKGRNANVNTDYNSLSRDKKIAFIKDKKWKYEREYRIVCDRDDEHFLCHESGKWFLPVKITNIYLGVNFKRGSNRETRKKIIEICNEKKITIKQMDLSEKNFGLVVKDVDYDDIQM